MTICFVSFVKIRKEDGCWISSASIISVSSNFDFSAKIFKWPCLNSEKGDAENHINVINVLIEEKNYQFSSNLNKYKIIFVKSEADKEIVKLFLDIDENESIETVKILVYNNY